MKKRYIIGIIVLLIAVILIGFGVYKYISKQNKEYEVIQIKEYNYFLLKRDNLFGVIDKSGNIIIEPQYEEIKLPNPERALFICYNSNNIEILNENKQQILTQYEKVEPIRLKNISSDLMYEKTVLKYTENNKYGLIDFDGNKITKNIYDEIEALSYKEGELLVKENEKHGIINIKGNDIVPAQYDEITVDGYYTDENQYKYAGYVVNNKTDEGYRYGYIDSNGKILVQLEYNELSRITDIDDNNNIYLICAKNGQYGLNKGSENITTNQYQSITYEPQNNILVVEKSKKYGICSLDGQVIIPIEHNQIDVTGKYIYAHNEQETKVYNIDGTQADINENLAILDTSNENYRIEINNENGTKYGVIDKQGNQIIETKYNYIDYIYDNYFMVSEGNGKLGVLDDAGNIILEIVYDAIQKIQKTDLLQANIASSKITQIYAKGMKNICEMQNATIEVKDEYLKIYNENDTKYFSKQGEELQNTGILINNKLFAKSENGKWGFIDTNGNVIVEYQYDKVTDFNEFGFASIKKDGKWGSINENGEIILEPTKETKDQTEPEFIGKYNKITYGFGEVYYEDLGTAP